MNRGGVSTSSTDLSVLETNIAKTELYITNFSNYYLSTIPYGATGSNTLFEIDLDLASISDNKKLANRKAKYVSMYNTYLSTLAGEEINGQAYTRAYINELVGNFESWLNGFSLRLDAFDSAYSEFMKE